MLQEKDYIVAQKSKNVFTLGRADHTFPRRYESIHNVCTAVVDFVRNNITTTDRIKVSSELRRNSKFNDKYYNKLGTYLCRAYNLPMTSLEAKL